MNERNSTIELLRIISMVLIIIFHFSGRAYNLMNINTSNQDIEILSKLIFQSLGQAGVPIFMFISGFYGMKFKKNRLIDMMIQCFIYTTVFYVMACCIKPELWGTRVFVLNLFAPSTQWFFYSYVVIYLFSDTINDFLNGLSFKRFTLIVILLLYFSIGLWIMKSSALNMFSLLELYVIARYTRLHLYKRINRYAVWFVLPTIILYLLPAYIGWQFNCIDKIQPYVNKYYNPFLVILCIPLIITADKYAFYNRYINSLASTALACLFIHANFYFPSFANPFFHFGEYSIVRIVLVSIGIYLFCYVIEKLRISIQNQIFIRK